MNHIGFPTLIIPENVSYGPIREIGTACDLKNADEILPFEII
jgi:hypothetical protein